MAVPETVGPFIKLGNLWVRYDLIGVVTPKRGASLQPDETGGEPYVMVVLTIPYKTIVVTDVSDGELFDAIGEAMSTSETGIGIYRAAGMRKGG